MSKTTFFKRVALTAIAALGLGALSVAPSQATATQFTVTGANGTSTLTGDGYVSDSTTAAVVTVNALLDTVRDSITVSFVEKSVPTGSAATARLYFNETTTPNSGTIVESTTAAASGSSATQAATAYLAASDSHVGIVKDASAGNVWRLRNASVGYTGAKFMLQLDSTTTRIKGTYTYTVIVKTFNADDGSVGSADNTTTQDVSIVVADTAANVAAAGGTIDPSKSTAFLSTAASPTADADVAVVATASNDTRATIRVRTYTSTSLQAPESVTVTITGPGLVGTSAGVYGKSITTAADGDDLFLIRSDGTAGVATIVVTTTTVTFPAKRMTFYAKAAKTITLEAYQPVVGVGTTTDVVRATITDADGIVWGGTAYIYASTATDATIASSATPAACSFVAALGKHQCPVTGKLKGSASLKVIDAATVATANVTSDAVSIRVSTGVATTAKISFDKATYAPGEKAQLRVSILDQDGLAMPAVTVNSAFAAALSSNVAFGAGSTSLSSSNNITLSGSTSAASDTNAGHQTFVVYMPMQAGSVTVTGVGSTGLAVAGRVAVTGTATVVAPADPDAVAAKAAADAATDAALEAIDAANAATDAANLAAEAADAATVAAEEARDAADAATAAVEALATEVASLIAGLKAQITTLANTVAKIAKKVKA